MNILVTGSKGFIAKNLISTLYNIRERREQSFQLDNDITIFEYNRDTDDELLNLYCKNADFVFHLAGVNRPNKEEEFYEGNRDLTAKILTILKNYHKKCPFMLASSTQAGLNNPYGISKRASEALVFQYQEETGARVYVYRFPNVFGKWCRPNYNSVVATFCYNITRNMPININDENAKLTMVYIDDLVKEMLQALQGRVTIDKDGYCYIPEFYLVSLGEIVQLLYAFKNSRNTQMIPDMTEGSFSKKLYATYLSYLPTDQFSYPLKMNVDNRGSFTEIVKSEDRGQISINISKPGIIKGEHWHHTKNEKFVVVSGKGLIRFRKIDSDEIIDYHVSGKKLEVVDIPVGYTHNIINEGDTDLITLMWCNECFDEKKPDTYHLNVDKTVV